MAAFTSDLRSHVSIVHCTFFFFFSYLLQDFSRSTLGVLSREQHHPLDVNDNIL